MEKDVVVSGGTTLFTVKTNAERRKEKMKTVGQLRSALVEMQSAWNQNAPITFMIGDKKYKVFDILYSNGELKLAWEIEFSKWHIKKTFIRPDSKERASLPCCCNTFISPDAAALVAAQNVYEEFGYQDGDIRFKSSEIVSALLKGMPYSYADVVWQIEGE